MFKLLKTEDKARRGEFTCPHGTVQTPVFMNTWNTSVRRSSFPTPITCIFARATRS